MSSQGRLSSKASSSGGSQKRGKIDPEVANAEKLRKFAYEWGLDAFRFELIAGAEQATQDEMMETWPAHYAEPWTWYGYRR